MNRRLPVLASALAALALVVPATSAAASPASVTSSAQAITDRPLLRLGDTGPSVRAWQRQMNLLTRSDSVDVDGIFDTSTERVTVNFQRFFGLAQDGIVGEHTRDVMRFMLGVTRERTLLATYDGRTIVGFPGEASYCFEVQAADDISVECPAVGGGPLNGLTIAVAGRAEPQLIGTSDPSVAAIQMDTVNGTVPADRVPQVPGLGRTVWSTSLPPSQITAVRALGADGNEVRRLAVTGGDTYLVIQRGDRGPAVTTWQEQLNAVTNAGLPVDGIFSERTTTATSNFQRFFGLQVDGVVGPQTRDAMTLVQRALAQRPS